MNISPGVSVLTTALFAALAGLSLTGCQGNSGGQPVFSSLPPPNPLVSSNVEELVEFPRDDDGVILRPDFDQHHPLAVAQFALGLYSRYMETEDPANLEAFWPQANWLRDSFVNLGEFGVWQYPFDYDPFEAESPWVSAFMQAFGLSVMIKAAALDPAHSDDYETVANLAMQAFEVPVAEGGVRSSWDDGTVWYEEYATPVDSHVLNGFIFSLSGLYEYWQQTGDAQARELFSQGVDALEQKLPDFDKGFTSAYGVYYNGVAQGQGGYHTTHINSSCGSTGSRGERSSGRQPAVG